MNLIISEDCSIVYKDVFYNYTDIVHNIELVLSAISRNKKNNNIRIGVYFRNDLDILISIIAILSSDNSYLPIDISLPIARVNQIIHDCDLILTDQDTDFLDIDKSKVVFKNNFDECIETYTNEFGRGEAYTIYTSGSTGTPKGVIISKKSLCNFLDGTSKAIDVSNCFVSISITSCSFDIYILETLWALQKGLKVVLIENSKRLNIKYIIKKIMDYEVDFLQTTPSRFRLFAIYKQFEDMLCHIKVLVLGGESFPDELKDRMISNTLKVYNAYGPTECTVWTSYSLVKFSDNDVDIGTEINNVEYQLLTQEKKEGFLLGELLIGGECLSDGYRYYKDLNMEKFIIINGQKYFRTGDVCKYENGKYYILGRYDNQVKINGNRIELEEIENVVKKMNGINEAVVLKQTYNGRDYLQLIYSADGNIEEKRIMNYLSNVIPFYMVPTKYLKIESFNYTIGGKIDRKKLREDVFDEKA